MEAARRVGAEVRFRPQIDRSGYVSVHDGRVRGIDLSGTGFVPE